MEAPYLRCHYNHWKKLCQEKVLMITAQLHPKTHSKMKYQNVSSLSLGDCELSSKNKRVTTTANHNS